MSFLTKRIGKSGSYLKNIKLTDTKNWFISSVKTLRGRLFKTGVGVAAITIFKVAANNDVEEADNILLNLDDIVTKRAWYLYTFDKRYKRFFFERKPIIVLDWSGVVFNADKPVYTKNNAGGNENHVTSKTILHNNSLDDQQHTLKANRQTTVIFSSSVTQGYLTSANVGLSIQAPIEIGVSTNISMQTGEENSKEDTFVWAVEDLIKVPKDSSVDVSMVLKQQEQEYLFTTNVEIQGSVRVKCYNVQKELTGIYDIPIRTLIMEEFPEQMTHKEEGDKTVSSIKIKGKCKFKHAMDTVVISPLKKKPDTQ